MSTTKNEQKKKAIQEFMAAKTVAFAGVSRDKKKFSYQAYEKIAKKNPDLIPVNPLLEEVDGKKCYKTLTEIPVNVDAVISMVPKAQTKGILEQALQKNIRNVWIQQSSDTPEALAFARSNNMNVIHGACILMYTEPVDSMHKLHRWVSKLFGNYPLS